MEDEVLRQYPLKVAVQLKNEVMFRESNPFCYNNWNSRKVCKRFFCFVGTLAHTIGGFKSVGFTSQTQSQVCSYSSFSQLGNSGNSAISVIGKGLTNAKIYLEGKNSSKVKI